jgi:acyl carrier protein
MYSDRAARFVPCRPSKKKKGQGMQNVEEMIRTYIAKNILFSGNGYPYPDDASFLNEGIVDSMNMLELVMFVEEQFDVHVEDQDIVPDNFDSVSKLATYVRRKLPSAV